MWPLSLENKWGKVEEKPIISCEVIGIMLNQASGRDGQKGEWVRNETGSILYRDRLETVRSLYN